MRSISDPSAAPRKWTFYLDDLARFAERDLAYTSGLDQDTFLSERLEAPVDARGRVCRSSQKCFPHAGLRLRTA